MAIISCIAWLIFAIAVLTVCARYSAKITRELKAQSGEAE
jgi:hypothetical protein